jgi:hypothetical protein
MALELKPLEYDRSPQHFAFRILIVLVFLQLVVTVQSNYAPGLVAMVKQRWEDHRAAVAHAEQVRQAAAAEQQCLQFSQPATKVVWEEDPTNAARLLTGEGYREIRPEGNWASEFRNAIPPGAFATLPAPIQASLPQPGPVGGHDAPIFVHSRTSPGGAGRLVIVWFTGNLQMSARISSLDNGRAFTESLYKGQAFHAAAYTPGVGEQPPEQTDAGATLLAIHPDFDRLEILLHWTPSKVPDEPGHMRVDRRDVLRIYAGQPDPADASHFTIAYTLDGTPGTIDGRLLDNDRVDLKPRTGAVVGERWYPRAAIAATQPATAH